MRSQSQVKSDPESVGSDPALTRVEQETTLTWAKDEQRVHVHSEIPGVASRLLQHPEFDTDETRVVDGQITRVAGTIPLGVLKISLEPRIHGSHAKVVTEQVLNDVNANE